MNLTIKKEKKTEYLPWHVRFPRGFRSPEEFFWVVRKIATIPETPFPSIPTSEAESRAEHATDVTLVGKGMRIAVKLACRPIEIIKKKNSARNIPPSNVGISRGIDVLSIRDYDWWVTFDELAHLEPVRIYKNRGRPREDWVAANVIGSRKQMSLKKVAAELEPLGIHSIEAVRYYEKRGKPRRAGNAKAEDSASRASKTSGN